MGGGGGGVGGVGGGGGGGGGDLSDLRLPHHPPSCSIRLGPGVIQKGQWGHADRKAWRDGLWGVVILLLFYYSKT